MESRWYEIKVFIPDSMGGSTTHFSECGTDFEDACRNLENRLKHEDCNLGVLVCGSGYDDEGNPVYR